MRKKGRNALSHDRFIFTWNVDTPDGEFPKIYWVDFTRPSREDLGKKNGFEKGVE